MTFDRKSVKQHLADLANHGVYVGTSSWKYPGWCGQLYDENRYVWRNKFSESRFNRISLEEYADTFKTVSVDAAYYAFPSDKYLAGLANQVPDDFRFAFKVTDEITVKHFPNLPRFGIRGGQPNASFLNPDLFASHFLRPCEPYRESVGLIMFEFSRFYPRDFSRGRDFMQALDRFLEAIPKGWPYGVEIRNRNFLVPEYFAMLKNHNVAHVFNNWDAMPSVEEQLQWGDIAGSDSLRAARFLLKPGRKYKDAVARFSPYREVKEINDSARQAGARIIRETLEKRRGKAFVFVNNRLEGNALVTVQAMLQEAARFRPKV